MALTEEEPVVITSSRMATRAPGRTLPSMSFFDYEAVGESTPVGLLFRRFFARTPLHPKLRGVRAKKRLPAPARAREVVVGRGGRLRVALDYSGCGARSGRGVAPAHPSGYAAPPIRSAILG